MKRCKIRIMNTRDVEGYEGEECMKYFEIRKYLSRDWICFMIDPFPSKLGTNIQDRVVEIPVDNIVSSGSGIMYQIDPGNDFKKHGYFKPIIHTDKNISISALVTLSIQKDQLLMFDS